MGPEKPPQGPGKPQPETATRKGGEKRVRNH